MLLSEAVRDYLEYARYEAGHSPRTLKCYQTRQNEFARWLTEQGFADPPIDTITVEMVRRFSFSFVARKLRPRTACGAIGAIRALFAYLVAQGALAEDPTRRVLLPKLDAADRKLVTDEDLEKLLEAAGRQHSDFRCVRDRAMLAVLIYCGLRRQELLDLRTDDLSLETRSLLVQQGKGMKARIVPLCLEAIPLLREWLAMASRVLQKGGDIRSIQALLGHAHLQFEFRLTHGVRTVPLRRAPSGGERSRYAHDRVFHHPKA
jgi:site-specific recombinase XerD